MNITAYTNKSLYQMYKVDYLKKLINQITLSLKRQIIFHFYGPIDILLFNLDSKLM